MPYSKSNSVPKFIYRVDKMHPSQVFQKGFIPLGTNSDFFNHVLGHTLSRKLDIQKASYLISCSESIDSATRFLGSMTYNIHNSTDYYLYKIRCTDKVYSTLRTANFYINKIRERMLKFNRGDYVVANEVIDSIYKEFSHQKEWFNVGDIEPSRIECAWKIEIKAFDKENVFVNNESLYYYPSLSDKKILNMGYNFENTHANPEPYNWNLKDGQEVLSIPETIFYTDVFGGTYSTLGFSCSLDKTKNIVQKFKNEYDVKNSAFGHCYIDRALLNKLLRNKYDVGPYKPSSVNFTYISLKSLKEDKNYWASWEQVNKEFLGNLLDHNNISNAAMFIYDNFNRISLKSNENKISYCWDLKKVDDGVYKLIFGISTINDKIQKFKLKHFKDNLFKVISLYNEHLSLHKKNDEANSRLYFKEYDENDNNFHELYIEIGKEKTLSQILLPQRSETLLIDLKLSWFYNRQFYHPTPENGFSKIGMSEDKKYFYDLSTFKIFYLNDFNEIFCLENKRYKNTSKWDWTRWQRLDLEHTNNDRLKWYFEYCFYEEDFSDVTFRKIKSFENGDLLKVYTKGVNWGSLITTKIKDPRTMKEEFAISKTSLI